MSQIADPDRWLEETLAKDDFAGVEPPGEFLYEKTVIYDPADWATCPGYPAFKHNTKTGEVRCIDGTWEKLDRYPHLYRERATGRLINVTRM